MQQLLCRISDTQPRLFVLKHSALRSNYQHVFSPGGRFVCNCLENGYYFAMCHMLLRAGRVHAECRYRCGRRWQQLAKPDARRGGGSDITGSLNNPLLPALVWNYQIEPDGSAKFLFEVFFPNFQPMPFPWLSGIHRQLIDLARVPLLYSLFLLLSPHPSPHPYLLYFSIWLFTPAISVYRAYVRVKDRSRIRLWCCRVCRCHGTLPNPGRARGLLKFSLQRCGRTVFPWCFAVCSNVVNKKNHRWRELSNHFSPRLVQWQGAFLCARCRAQGQQKRSCEI